jgi:hypothetical protein
VKPGLEDVWSYARNDSKGIKQEPNADIERVIKALREGMAPSFGMASCNSEIRASHRYPKADIARMEHMRIKYLRNLKVSVTELAREYGVTHGTIRRVIETEPDDPNWKWGE